MGVNRKTFRNKRELPKHAVEALCYHSDQITDGGEIIRFVAPAYGTVHAFVVKIGAVNGDVMISLEIDDTPLNAQDDVIARSLRAIVGVNELKPAREDMTDHLSVRPGSVVTITAKGPGTLMCVDASFLYEVQR